MVIQRERSGSIRPRGVSRGARVNDSSFPYCSVRSRATMKEMLRSLRILQRLRFSVCRVGRVCPTVDLESLFALSNCGYFVGSPPQILRLFAGVSSKEESLLPPFDHFGSRTMTQRPGPRGRWFEPK